MRKYWKEWKRADSAKPSLVLFEFIDSTLRGELAKGSGPGWKADIMGGDTVSLLMNVAIRWPLCSFTRLHILCAHLGE